MNADVTISTAGPSDIAAIQALVRGVAGEVYGDLLHDPERIEITDSAGWWVAQSDGRIIAAGCVKGDYVSDLWVEAGHRGSGVGAALLRQLEGQIAADGHARGRLRVVRDNDGARRFYRRHGWDEIRTYPHERDGHMMVDYHKPMT